MLAMNVKHLAHLALAGLLVFGTGATGAENQNQKGKPAPVRSGGGANAGGAKFHVQSPGSPRLHLQSQGNVRIHRDNAARIHNHNRLTVRQQDFNRNLTHRREVTRHRAVINQNVQKQSVQRLERNRTRAGEERRTGKRVAVQISQTQRVRIREAYRHHRRHFHRVARVGFPIFVGADVPSDYAFYDVPEDIVEYVPEYEGYKYIIVGDLLLIIDPETWEIVAIIQL
jgi:uncharacterized protein DUF1236